MSGVVRKAGLYWHTLRHLKPSQLWWQLRYRLMKPKVPADGPPPAARARVDMAAWVPPAPRPNTLHEGWTFQHLQVRATWDEAVADPDARELLWQYRFHEFEDLVAAGAAGAADGGAAAAADDEPSRRALHAEWIARWIAAFPPLTKAAWDPYPISMRVGNWVRWALAAGALDDAARASMARQLRHLEQRLEFHLRANHLMENAKALYLGGSFLDGAAADRWRARGRKLLREQVAEQILADGGHCERSPMYHGLMLEALQDCASVARVYGDAALADELAPTLAKMDRWLRAMTHPDGGIAFFQDACHGVALPPADLHTRSAALCEVDDSPFPPALHLEASGFARLEQGDAVLFQDVGVPGPAWQPGHAHAGTLSFELSLEGRRLFVNTGTSCYGSSGERLRQRGTRAHNAVQFSGLDSSEVWSGFRVARRVRRVRARVDDGVEPFPRPDDPHASVSDTQADVEGYRGAATVCRTIVLAASGFALLDLSTGAAGIAIASLHLAPESEVEAGDPGTVRVRAGGRLVDVRVSRFDEGKDCADETPTTVTVEDAELAPAFGVTVPSRVLRIAYPAGATLRVECDFSAG